MLWKNKTDTQVLSPVHIEFYCSLQLDSSLSDEEIVADIKRQLKEHFASDFTLTIGRIERDPEGKIYSLRKITF